MPAALPPPFPPVVMQCATMAAQEYAVPRILLLSIIKTESGGNINAFRVNRNGTHDTGPMQINTVWAQRLEKRYGIHHVAHHLRNDACYNIRVGAWILKNELSGFDAKGASANEYWRRVGNYHSRTPSHNERYRWTVIKNMRWLINHDTRA